MFIFVRVFSLKAVISIGVSSAGTSTRVLFGALLTCMRIKFCNGKVLEC